MYTYIYSTYIYNIYLRRQRASIVESSTAGLTLGIDSRHENKKTGFYPKCLRPFLRILGIVDLEWLVTTNVVDIDR